MGRESLIGAAAFVRAPEPVCVTFGCPACVVSWANPELLTLNRWRLRTTTGGGGRSSAGVARASLSSVTASTVRPSPPLPTLPSPISPVFDLMSRPFLVLSPFTCQAFMLLRFKPRSPPPAPHAPKTGFDADTMRWFRFVCLLPCACHVITLLNHCLLPHLPAGPLPDMGGRRGVGQLGSHSPQP